MIASTKGEEELVRVLVKHGAEVNKRKTGDGCTALMFAAAKGHDEIVRFLLSHHADVNTRNRYALHTHTHTHTQQQQQQQQQQQHVASSGSDDHPRRRVQLPQGH
jgi:ankyrin repeat protein